MKRKIHKKQRSIWLKIFMFIVKVPLYVLIAGLTARPAEEEDSVIQRLAKLDPSVIDPHPPKRR